MMIKALGVLLAVLAMLGFVATPALAGQATPLSDKELEGVYAGDGIFVSDDFIDEDASVDDVAVAGADFDSSIAQAASDNDDSNQVANSSDDGYLEMSGSGFQSEVNAVSLLNTLASTNAVQVNAANGSGGSQSNVAYSNDVGIGAPVFNGL